MKTNVAYSDSQLIHKAIKQAIDTEIDRVFEEEKERVIARLEAEKSKLIAQTAMTLSKMYSIETLGQSIVIRVERKDV